MSEVFVKASSISRSFGEKVVLRDVSFSFEEPGIYLIEGDSGSGKTTLLRILAGLDVADSGTLRISGKTGVVFQEPRLFDDLSLLDNIRLVRNGSGRSAEELLEKTGLLPDASTPARKASGGMRQRTAILRALYFGPDVLLCDEPFSALDDVNAVKAASLIEEFAAHGICIVASHGGEDHFKNVKEIVKLPLITA